MALKYPGMKEYLMKIIDAQGRLFGKINIIDLLVILFFINLIPVFYFSHRVITQKKADFKYARKIELAADVNEPRNKDQRWIPNLSERRVIGLEDRVITLDNKIDSFIGRIDSMENQISQIVQELKQIAILREEIDSIKFNRGHLKRKPEL